MSSLYFCYCLHPFPYLGMSKLSEIGNGGHARKIGWANLSQDEFYQSTCSCLLANVSQCEHAEIEVPAQCQSVGRLHNALQTSLECYTDLWR